MTTIQKIDAESQPGVENSLNLFTLPPTTVAFNKSTVRELLPITALDNQGPYCFRIFSDSQFIDLTRVWFYLETCIEKQSGGAWTKIAVTDDDKNVGVVNNFGNSFIKRLDIRVNGKELFNSGNNYAYRAFINHELFTSNETRKTLSEATCYYADTHSNSFQVDHYKNDGFVARRRRFANGQTCQTMAKLDFDLAEQENLFINNVDVLFTIYRNDDDWLILAPNYRPTNDGAVTANSTNYRIRVLAMKIYVVTVDVVQSLQNAIARHLESSPAKYALRKVEVRNFYLGPGRQDFVYNVFQSTAPRRIIAAFVDRSAYIGDVKQSPFYFNHAQLRSISIEAGGNVWPAVPYDFNFEQNRFVRGFVDMYEHLNLVGRSHSINLTMPKYQNGWTFFTFNLTSTLKDTSAFELIRNSTTVIKAVFNAPIQHPGYELIVFAEFDQIITVNSDRILSSDGSIV